jgi:hypothetical protein
MTTMEFGGDLLFAFRQQRFFCPKGFKSSAQANGLGTRSHKHSKALKGHLGGQTISCGRGSMCGPFRATMPVGGRVPRPVAWADESLRLWRDGCTL